jgi:signal transduction histidine kinase
MEHRSPPLSFVSVMIVLCAGLLMLLATGVLGVLRFAAIPDALATIARVDEAKSAFVASLALIGAVFLALSVLAAWLSARAVSGDVHFVTRRVRTIAERGDLGEPVAIRSLDEVGALTRAFEQLRRGYVEQLIRERTAHRQAQEADRYKGEFLTTVSHELRTPLNALLGFSEVLLAEIEGPLTEGQREDLRMIRASGEHLLALFNNVLDFSALASGRIKLNLEPVDVQQVLEEVASILEGQRQGKRVAIVVDCPHFMPELEADPVRLRQILMNLGTNALKFTPTGEVRLWARFNGREVTLGVRDTGIGIAPEDVPLLFEEFTQVGTSEHSRRGSGLGLSIVRQLVELHAGRVELESELGRGSQFSVILPVRIPELHPERTPAFGGPVV